MFEGQRAASGAIPQAPSFGVFLFVCLFVCFVCFCLTVLPGFVQWIQT